MISWTTILIVLAVIIAARIVIRLVFIFLTGKPLYGGNGSKPELTAVRLGGDPSTLAEVQKAAAGIGWSRSTFDTQGRLMLTPPSDYHPDQFGKLLAALEPFHGRDFGLQLIGPNGKPVGPDGTELPE